MNPRISVCMTTRGKNWLLARAIQSWLKQDLPPEEWELIVVDDCSDEPISPVLAPVREAGLQIRDFRLEHADGWRGITVGMLYAFAQARGEFLMETNSHLLLPPSSVRLMIETHESAEVRKLYCQLPPVMEKVIDPKNLWISLRGFTMNTEATEKMDSVDWKQDLGNLWQIPETDCDWTKMWLPGYHTPQFYGSHLCCSIRRDTFEKVQPWPAEGFRDYGTDDPAYAGARRRAGMIDLNIWPAETMFAHLAHNNHIEDAMELCPTKLNKNGHSKETASFWDAPGDRNQKPKLQEVIDYWSVGNRTTDWRVRKAFGYPTPEPDAYIARARALISEGKSLLEELIP